MGDPAARTSRLGAWAVAAAVGGSAAGVLGWHFTNRSAPELDTSGFDLATTEGVERPSASSSPARRAAAPSSGLGMLKAEAGIRVAGQNENAAAPGAAGAAGGKTAALGFKEAARKHEGAIRRFGERMTRQHPGLLQYARDWMSHPDLRRLTQEYHRTKDPVAFMVGLSRAPSVGPMLKKYAGSPDVRAFIVQGVKEAPGELLGAAVSALQEEKALKSFVAGIAGNLGLPPSVTAVIGGADPKSLDQNQVMREIMSSPQAQDAMRNQPVQLGR